MTRHTPPILRDAHILQQNCSMYACAFVQAHRTFSDLIAKTCLSGYFRISTLYMAKTNKSTARTHES